MITIQSFDSGAAPGTSPPAPEAGGRFARVERLARTAFDVPTVLVSVLGEDPPCGFCEHVTLGDQPLVIPDTLRDMRFASDPLVRSERPVRFHVGHPLRLADGTRAGTLCVMDGRPRDVDQRDLAVLADLAGLVAEQLRRQEPSLRQQGLMDSLADGLLILDQEGRVEACNRALCGLLGRLPDEVSGHLVAEFLDEVSAVDIERRLAAVARAGRPVAGLRFAAVQAGGRPRPVEVSLSRVQGFGPARFLAVVRDTGVRQQLERALLEREDRLHTIVEGAAIGITEVDAASGRLLSANPYLLRLIGWSEAEFATGTLTWMDMTHPADREQADALYEDLAEGRLDRGQVELRFLRRDRSEFWGNLTASAVRGPDGRPQHFIGLLEDADERRRLVREMEMALQTQREANELLTRVNRDKANFVGMVSHEFRTALTGLQGYAEMLRDHDLEQGEMREFAGDIHREAGRLNRIIEDMLELERMEAGRTRLNLAPVDVNSLLTMVVERARLASSEHKLSLRLSPDLQPVRADADSLLQVFANLVGNAVRYTPSGGSIEVASSLTEGGIRVTVTDDGVGIPADSLELVFERYSRLDVGPGAGGIGTGIGIGLTMARRLVSMHGGRVWAENAPGGGARLVVQLPRQPPAQGSVGPAAPAARA